MPRYPLTCDIEIGLAQSAQLQAAQSYILPVKPSIEGETVITVFWLDNFDMNVESATCGGAINTTYIQEETEHTSLLYTHTNVERTKSRGLKIENVNFGRLAINIKQELPVFSQIDELQVHEVVNPFCMNYLIWVIIRSRMYLIKLYFLTVVGTFC